jgi:pyruvate dehydrogenase E2 component (dihydrolipoamide acetyltransferase)
MTAAARITGWRRIASAMWRAPDDPQIFGDLDVDARPVLEFIDRARHAGHRVTPTHLVGRAVAHAMRTVPELNVKIRRGRAYPRETIDVFFVTSVAAGQDLSGVKVVDTGTKSAVEVADELTRRATAMKRGRDQDFARTKRFMDRAPPWLLRRAIRLTTFITEDLGLDLPVLALRKTPFGSAMVTSVGMFGLAHGNVPLAWMYDVPLLVLVGEIAPKPVVVAGAIEARDVLPINATIDHRYVDGWHISRALKAFREYLEAPQRFEPEPTVVAEHRANETVTHGL